MTENNNLHEQELQNALINMFLTNLTFLSDFDKELFNRVDGLSYAINEGLYEERYTLEFLKEVGEFDIFDKKENKFVYDKNPQKLINKARNLDFSSKGSFSNLKPGIYSGKRFDMEETISKPVSLDDSIKLIINDSSDFVEVMKTDTKDYSNKKYKEFEKFMILGTLLGRHLLPIHKKFKPKVYFIAEPNLEIFRLSLFVFDYTQLIMDGSALFFSIMDDDDVFDKKIMPFIMYKPYNNYCVKFFTSDYNVSELFDKTATAFTSHNPFAYSYTSSLYNLLNNDTQLLGKYERILLNKTNKCITEKPVMYIGAGPSLEQEITWLQENKDNFIIVAMAAALKKLVKHNIVPDIISTVDSNEDAILRQFDFENNLDLIKDKIVLASSMTGENILNKFKKENIFTFDVMTSLFKDSMIYTAFSVGEMTLSWLLSLKVERIYLLGLDLALNQETGATHIQEHESSSNINISDRDFFVESGNFLNGDVVEVEGNFNKKVYTTRLFHLSLKAMNNIMEILVSKKQKIYNLSKNGAKINKTIPLKTNEIKLTPSIDKELNFLRNNLKEQAIKSLSEKEKELLDSELNILKEYLLFLKESIENIKNFEEFNRLIIKIYDYFSKNSNDLVASKRFLSLYLDSSLMFICYSLNDRKLKQEKKKIKEIIEILFNHSEKMIGDYENYISRIK